MVIQHNMQAMNSSRQFNVVVKDLSKSTEKLSSGYRINRSADDAAGLQISEKMRSQIRGFDRGSDNIQEGISLARVADGALTEVHSMLQRMNELAVQAANGTNSLSDRAAIQKEVDQLVVEIDRIGESTTFNGKHLFTDPDGSAASGIGSDGFRWTDPGSITSLVPCPSAEKGVLSEAYKRGSLYYPAATMDFSKINESNIYLLDGSGFFFSCSQNCNEAFQFTFVTGSTPSSTANLVGRVTHEYTVNIGNCKNGEDVMNTLFEFVRENPSSSDKGSSPGTDPYGGLEVSHSNVLYKEGSKLIVSSNSANAGSNPEDVTDKYTKSSNPHDSGQVDCKNLASIIDEDTVRDLRLHKYNDYMIHCSSSTKDKAPLRIQWMNSNFLGVDRVNVMSERNATKSINYISDAIDIISAQRSEIGAYQNRLEHSYENNRNKEENTTAAESRIRDTDMAKEMVN